MDSQKDSTVMEELRYLPLSGFSENLILSTSKSDPIARIWEPKTLAPLQSYNVIEIYTIRPIVIVMAKIASQFSLIDFLDSSLLLIKNQVFCTGNGIMKYVS